MKANLDLELEGVVGLVGGGARHGGISQSILERLLMAGMRIAFIDTDPNGKVVEQCLRDRGADVLFVEGDLRSFADANRFVHVVERELGPAKVIVNAIGGHPEKASGSGPAESRAEQIMAYVSLNVVTHVQLIEAALPMLLDQEGDKSVVSIGTINPKLPWLQERDYAGAKNQLETHILDYAALHARHGIRFNIIHPGSVPGPLSKTWPDRLKNPVVRAHLRNLIPLGRLGRPSDISFWALMFASPLADWATGQALCIDGGAVGAGGQAAPADGRWWFPNDQEAHSHRSEPEQKPHIFRNPKVAPQISLAREVDNPDR